MNDRLGSSAKDGHVVRVGDQFFAHVIGHRPADDAATADVEYDREEQKAGVGRNVRVSSPRESHPRALAEPDVNLSAHPAPITEPPT